MGAKFSDGRQKLTKRHRDLVIFFKITVIDNQEKSESFRTLNYNVINVIMELRLLGLNQPPCGTLS